MSGENSFHEEQKFNQKWLWLILILCDILVIGLFGFGMIKQLVYGEPWGDDPMPDTGLIITGTLTIILMLAVTFLLLLSKLITEVNTEKILLTFFPLAKKTILYEDIISCNARTYKPFLEFGGWGLRFGFKSNAYNVSGKRGVQLEIRNKKNFLIGSQKADELERAINYNLEQNGFKKKILT